MAAKKKEETMTIEEAFAAIDEKIKALENEDISLEDSFAQYKEGMEPYYPVNDEHNNQLAEKYRQLATQEENIIFGGRLAEYKYYDMAPVIEKVMNIEII